MSSANAIPVLHSHRRVVILTALGVEYQAALEHLTAIKERVHKLGTVYDVGTFYAATGSSWEVALVEVGPGNVTAALEAARAIEFFSPDIVLFIGVAGGLKDVRVGDVVAATKVYSYESGKASSTFLPRPDVYRSTHRMVHRARAEARKKDWLQRVRGPLSDHEPDVFVGAIAAGEKVVSSSRSSIYDFLKSAYGDALAVEMEGYGFLEAAHSHQRAEALVIRGISDLLDGKSASDAAGSQEIASRNASAFGFEILSKLAADDIHGEWVITLIGTIAEFDESLLEQMVSRLRELSGDASLAIKSVRPGSILVTVQGSRAGYEQVESLFKSGQFSRLQELEIEQVNWVAPRQFPTHLGLLKKDVNTWNVWRMQYPNIRPLLEGADLHGLSLRHADLRKAMLANANLSETDLQGANLVRADLTGADVKGSDLREAILIDAELNQTDFQGATLVRADLTGSNLKLANLGRSVLGATVFGDVDLSDVMGLETVRHERPSTIGIDTVYRSRHQVPEAFLRGAGVPEEFIAYMKLAGIPPIEYYSCFISYSSKDQEFAKRLHLDLQSKGVRCWFAPEDLKIGDRFRPRIDESIRIYDKLLLILSGHSVGSPWVEKEVEMAFEKEHKQNRTVLFPIRLDDAVMEAEEAWTADLRRTRHIGDFREWRSHDGYQRAFARLMRDLKAGAKGQ